MLPVCVPGVYGGKDEDIGQQNSESNGYSAIRMNQILVDGVGLSDNFAFITERRLHTLVSVG